MPMTVSHVSLDVRRLPEGVYLATSVDVPGLTVEADTREEAEAAARAVAVELIEEELGHALERRPDFTVTYL
jgi:predicted RNase H-like HicB family nuclease